MVRSTGSPVLVDGDAFAPHHPERLVHGAERVRAQRDRTQHLPGPHLDLDTPALALGQAELARRRCPHRARVTWAEPVPAGPRRARPAPPVRRAPRPSPRPARRAPPAGRPPRPPRPAHPGRARAAVPPAEPGRSSRRCARRGRCPCRRPVVPMASGGRFGPRRTTSSRRHRTRTATPVSSASARAPARHAGCGACPRRRPRWPAAWPGARRGGTNWRPARRRRARPSVVCSVNAHSPSGTSTGCDRGTVLLRP